MKNIIAILRNKLIEVTSEDTKLRFFLKSIYMNLPRRYRQSYILERTISTLGKIDEIKFIQIGANDGIHSDPLFKYVKKRNWKGLMLEPNPVIMQKLIKNHRQSRSELIYEKLAIGEEGEFALFWCEEKPGVASTSRNHVERHIRGRDYQILEDKIQMVSFSKLILAYPQFSKVDLLLMDTEGWDGKIITSIDFKKFSSDIIIFESLHLSSEEFNASINHLESAGYKCFTARLDTVAIKRNPSIKELYHILERSHKL